MPTIIYALLAEGEGVRYIGMTRKPLESRFKQHWADVRKGKKTRKAQWLRRCALGGVTVTAIVLEIVDDDKWEEREVFWISQYQNLVNVAPGGIGGATRIGQKSSPEHCAKMSAALRGRPPAPQTIAASVAARKGKKANLSDEARERLRAGGRKRVMTAELRAKYSASAKRQMAARKAAGYRVSEETRAKLAEATKRREAEKKAAGYVISEETRKRMSESAKRRWARDTQPLPLFEAI